MGAEGKRYLQDHSIPQLFESLMTGLIYNKPEDPLDFLELAIGKIKANPDLAVKWDTFIDTEFGPNPNGINSPGNQKKSTKKSKKETTRSSATTTKTTAETATATTAAKESKNSSKTNSAKSTTREMPSAGHTRVPSVTKAAEVARIPSDVPIILFIGGPGGGKTRIAARVRDAMENEGLVHICMPDLVKQAITKYKDRYPEWRDAAMKYERGELIPNHLAEDIVKAEMGRHPEAKSYFLEGFPREARQVEDFERNVRPINMALILDYDEDTLRRHMQARGLSMDVMDKRINEFKQKTLPAAKYFDDQRLLHLIPGEREDGSVIERMKKLILRAIELGVPIYQNSASNTPETATNHQSPPPPETPAPVQVPVPTSSAPPSTTPVKPPTSHSRTSAGSGDKSVKSPPPTTNGVKASVASPPVQSPANSPQVPTSMAHPLVEANTPTQSTPPVPTESQQQQPQTSKPSTQQSQQQHSRPSSNVVPREKENSPPKVQTPPVVENERSASSVASTPKLPEGTFKEITESQSNESTRILTANADKFPKGLPNNSPVILIIGGPGSNKLELSKKISQKYDGFTLLSMGELLRKKVLQNADDELWQRIGKKMDMGETIPFQICREVLYSALHDIGQGSWGYVVEGYPRNQKQCEDLEQQLGRLDIALLIDCTEQFCKDNISKRYKEGLETGHERKDDQEDIVQQRLGLFKQNTLPMLKYLDDKGKLNVVRVKSKKVDGDTNNIDVIFKDVVTAIDNTVFIQDNEGGRSLTSSKHNSVDENK